MNERDERKSTSWGVALAAITLGVLVILVVVALYLGLRGLW